LVVMTSATAPDGSVGNPLPRQAARVVLIDSEKRVLLFRGFDPASPEIRFWFTVGGGLDEGETPAEGAVRELREETGLALGVDSLEGPIWHQTTDFPYDGRWYRQEQDFFAVRVASWQVSMDGQDLEERATIDGHRWWSVAELLATSERYYPLELPALVNEILGS
jgi:8-oxo-dGTP pyrophosphatase MutT (NUDIX family)